VNDLPQATSSSSIAMYADDTKCYHPVRTLQDDQYLQNDLDGVNEWCQEWQMDVNKSKCEVLSVTRNVKPVKFSYLLKNIPISKTNVQKDLGVVISSDLKWNQHVSMSLLKLIKCLATSQDLHWTSVMRKLALLSTRPW
jgi:hypothetical protein